MKVYRFCVGASRIPEARDTLAKAARNSSHSEGGYDYVPRLLGKSSGVPCLNQCWGLGSKALEP